MKQGFFERLYLWSFESKRTGGMYFLAFVTMYMVLGAVTIGTSVSLDFWTAVQMLVACVLIGFGQNMILPHERLNAKRCVAWGAYSVVITIGSAIWFGWFDGFPLWGGIVFYASMTIGFMMLWPAFYWQAKLETQRSERKSV